MDNPEELNGVAWGGTSDVWEPFTCPRCKTEILSPTVLGWLIKRDKHTDHTGHKRHNAHTPLEYCEVPCPECAEPARARRKAEQIAELLGLSHIPYNMQKWSFASVPEDFDQEVLAQCKAFASGTLRQRGMFLNGPTGVGKSGMAIAIIHTAIHRGESAAFIRTIDLMNRLREAVSKSMRHEPSDGDALLDLAKTVTWLALDDLATERPTSFVLEQLYALIEARRSSGLFTVFTCNFNLAELEQQWRPDGVSAGAFHAGRRVTDRIGEYCIGIQPKNGNLRRRSRRAA